MRARVSFGRGHGGGQEQKAGAVISDPPSSRGYFIHPQFRQLSHFRGGCCASRTAWSWHCYQKYSSAWASSRTPSTHDKQSSPPRKTYEEPASLKRSLRRTGAPRCLGSARLPTHPCVLLRDLCPSISFEPRLALTAPTLPPPALPPAPHQRCRYAKLIARMVPPATVSLLTFRSV